MDHTTALIQAVHDVIVNPTPASFWPLFTLSFINDLFGVFPFALVLAGQLAFLENSFTLALAAKLLVFVALPVGLGSALGSMPLYIAAYFGGKPLITKFHRFLRFSWQDVEKVKDYFRGTWYDEIIFFLLRCVPILPSVPLDVYGGIIRMPLMPFFVLTAVGSIVRMMLTLLVVGMSLNGLAQF